MKKEKMNYFLEFSKHIHQLKKFWKFASENAIEEIGSHQIVCKSLINNIIYNSSHSFLALFMALLCYVLSSFD